MPTSAAANAGSKANENRSAAADAGGKGGASSSGGSKAGGGKMGASSSQSGGTKSSAAAGSKSSASSSAGRGPAASKAAASAGTKASSPAAKSGPGGAGGVRNTSSGTRPSNTAAKVGGTIGTNPSKAALSARAQAVSRGPGLLGSLNSTKPGDQNRALTSIGLSLGERYGLPGNQGIAAAREMAKTLAGEVGKFGQLDYDAAARTMTNRLDAMRAGYTGFGDTVRDMLGAYDANRYTTRTQIPATLGAFSSYKAAKPGTANFQKGITGLANAMSPYGAIENSPVARATHYYSGPQTQGYQKGFTAFGPHNFGTPDLSTGQVARATQAALSSPGPLSRMASQPSVPSPPSLDAQIAALQARSPTAGLRAAAIPQSREQAAGLTGNLDTFNSMDMGGYRSPMTGLTGMPQAPSNMNMGGYQSPMTGLSGMPPAPGSMNMAGYQSPMAGTTGMPRANPAGMGNYRSPMTGLGGMPNVPANMDMGGYNSPMAQVGALPGPRNPASGMSFNPGMPRNPQSGMSFTPGLPRNPESGMSFNPSMPRNPVGGMSFTPGLPGQMPGPERSRSPAVSGPEDDLVAGYSNPSRSFAGIPANGLPTLGRVDPEINPQDDPMDPIDVASYDPLSSISPPVPGMPMDINPELQNYPQPYMGERYTFSVPGRPKGTRRSVAPDSFAKKTALTTLAGLAGVPAPGLGLDALQSLGHAARQGKIGNRPGQPYANGMDHADTYQGGSGANDLPMQWTGRESPSQVANMQQHVEEVLRGYFVQVPGMQYPQYTTG